MRMIAIFILPLLIGIANAGEIKRELPKSRGFYILVVPENFDPKKPADLVVALHGSGDTAENFAREMAQQLSGRNIVLAVPQAGDTRYWQHTDIPRVAEAVADVQRYCNVNKETQTVLGFSGGCSFCFDLLVAQPLLFTRVAALGHALPEDVKEHQLKPAAVRAAVFYSIGLKDSRHSKWKAGLEKLKKLKFNVKSEELEDQDHILTEGQISRAFEFFDSLKPAPAVKK